MQASAWALFRFITCLSLGGSMARLAAYVQSTTALSGIGLWTRLAALELNASSDGTAGVDASAGAEPVTTGQDAGAWLVS